MELLKQQKILVLKKKMKNSRGAAKQRYKNQALQLLKRRKMYDQQAGIIGQQQFNVDQMSFTMDSIKDTQTVVATMKETAKTMKTQFEELNIDEVDDLYDDMDDMMMDADEMNEIMGRNMGNMDEIDDDELEAELDGLSDLEDMEEPDYLEANDMPVVNAQETVTDNNADAFKLSSQRAVNQETIVTAPTVNNYYNNGGGGGDRTTRDEVQGAPFASLDLQEYYAKMGASRRS